MTNQGTIGGRLRYAREERGLSLEVVGKAVGVSPQAVQQWEKDRTAPDPDRLAKVASFLGCNISWLITGRALQEQEMNVRLRSIYHLGGRPVPRLTLKDITDGRFSALDQSFIHTHFPCSERSYSLVLEDASCAPLFVAGDSVVIDPQLHPEPGDMVLAIAEGRAIFRRLRMLSGGRYGLDPLNDLWSSSEVDASAILGVMSEHTRPRRR